MIACPTCAREWPDEARFCMQCGTPLTPSPAQPEERKIVTSLFCDLVSFTEACENTDPEIVDRVLRAYHAMARRVIESHGGTVEKFIGDAVVAIFGVPAAHEDDPERAVRAGLRIIQEAEELRGIMTECLRLRVGVNTGAALVRLDVTPGSGEGFVTGDAVNTAARLQAAALPMTVAVGAATHELTALRFDFEELEPVSAKGKAEPLPIWLVKGARSRLGAIDSRRSATPLVGRETETAFLTALFEKAVSVPSPQIALIVGEPGIGKSRLVTELFAYIDAKPGLTTWREGRCLPYGDGITFWALGEIVKADAGILETDDPETAAAKLERAVPARQDREWMLGRLRALVGLEAAEADREENFAAWLLYLEELAAARPIILVFEDLHWADAALLAFLEHLARHVSALPMFVVCTARPELFERHPSFAAAVSRVNRISIDRLTNAETEQLVATLLEGSASPRLVETIVRRSEGNPYYAEESARLVADQLSAGLEIIDGAWSAQGAGQQADAPLPGSVQAILAARLDSLPAQLKAILGDAAVVGDVFSTDALAAVAGMAREEADTAVAELISRQLLRRTRTSTMAGEQELSFWHALARDVAYHQQSRAVRARKHVAVAAWLEGREGGRVEDMAEVLAHHYTTAHALAVSIGESGLADDLAGPAARHLTAAGERVSRLDLATALHYFTRALEILPEKDTQRGVALRLQARAQCLSGKLRDGIEAYLQAVDFLLAGGDKNAAACCTVDMALWMATAGDPRWMDDIESIHEVVDDESPSADLVHVYQELAGVLAVRLWDYSGAMQAANRALEVAASIHVPAPPGAFEWRSEAKACLGDREYIADYERALELAEAQDVGSNALARLHHNHAHILAAHAGPSEALAALRANMDFAQRRGMEFWVSTGRCSSTWLLLAAGRWEEAGAEIESLAPALLEAGWGEGEELAIARSARGALLAWTGAASHDAHAAEAERLAAWLPDQAKVGKNDSLLSSTCLLTAAELLASRGDDEGSHELLVRCLDGPRIGPWGPCCEGSPEGLLPRAVRLALRVDDAELAARFVVAAVPLAPVDEHGIASARALVDEARGAHALAADSFAAAAARWHGFGVPYEEAQALLGQGRCLAALGEPVAAAKPLAAARQTFARLGASPALAEADEWLARIESM